MQRARKTLDPAHVDAVERAVRQITKAVLHTPTARARDLAKEGREREYEQALSLLFDLEKREA
jgi:glutamyl-tRNA reductase